MAALVVESAHTTQACFICVIPYQSLLDRIESAEKVVIARNDESRNSNWTVNRVLKGKEIAIDQKLNVDLKRSAGTLSGQMHILRFSDLDRSWVVESPTEHELNEFLIKSLTLKAGLPEESSLLVCEFFNT